MKSTEKATQAAIVEWLTWKRIFHYRQNSGTFRTEAGGFYRMGVAGAPDIVAMVNGVYIGIEVKDTKGNQNANQIAFQRELEEAGGMYILATSIDDVQGGIERR